MSEETTESTGAAAPEAGKRPVFLTVLCILSFIAAGFAILGYITLIGVATAASAVAGAAMEGLEGMEGMEGMGDAMAAAAGPSVGMMWANIVVGFLATIVGLMGVLKMWKLKASGFMLYAGAAVVSIIMSVVYTGFMVNIVGIIISAAFIAMYYINKKHMTA